MEQRETQLTERLVAAVQELPEEQIAEVPDFASYSRAKYEHPGPPTVLPKRYSGCWTVAVRFNSILASSRRFWPRSMEKTGLRKQ